MIFIALLNTFFLCKATKYGLTAILFQNEMYHVEILEEKMRILHFNTEKGRACAWRFSDCSGVKHAIRTEYGELPMTFFSMTAINLFLTFLFRVNGKTEKKYSIL